MRFPSEAPICTGWKWIRSFWTTPTTGATSTLSTASVGTETAACNGADDVDDRLGADGNRMPGSVRGGDHNRSLQAVAAGRALIATTVPCRCTSGSCEGVMVGAVADADRREIAELHPGVHHHLGGVDDLDHRAAPDHDLAGGDAHAET